MAKYQLDIGLTNSTECQFTKDDTAAYLMSRYDKSQNNSSHSVDNEAGNERTNGNVEDKDDNSSERIHAVIINLIGVLLIYRLFWNKASLKLS